MKEFIATFVLALVVSCLFYSLAPGPPPYPWPVGINTVQQSAFGLKREEEDIGEVNFVDGARPVKIMTVLDEKSKERSVDLPLGANN